MWELIIYQINAKSELVQYKHLGVFDTVNCIVNANLFVDKYRCLSNRSNIWKSFYGKNIAVSVNSNNMQNLMYFDFISNNNKYRLVIEEMVVNPGIDITSLVQNILK